MTNSIFKWDKAARVWVTNYTFTGNGITQTFPFVTDGFQFLAVCNHYTGSTYVTNSLILRLNPSTGNWDVNFTITTNGCHDVVAFVIDGAQFLAFAEYNNGAAFSFNSRILRLTSV